VVGLQISALQSAGLRISGSEGLRVWVGRSFCLVGMVNIHLGSEGQVSAPGMNPELRMSVLGRLFEMSALGLGEVCSSLGLGSA
jgi:hypothetical protein